MSCLTCANPHTQCMAVIPGPLGQCVAATQVQVLGILHVLRCRGLVPSHSGCRRCSRSSTDWQCWWLWAWHAFPLLGCGHVATTVLSATARANSHCVCSKWSVQGTCRHSANHLADRSPAMTASDAAFHYSLHLLLSSPFSPCLLSCRLHKPASVYHKPVGRPPLALKHAPGLLLATHFLAALVTAMSPMPLRDSTPWLASALPL